METITFMISCWLLTYLIHSTAFYGIAKLLARTPVFAHTRAKEMLWKVALCAGILTASAQVFTGAGVFTSTQEVSSFTQVVANEQVTPEPVELEAVANEAASNDLFVNNPNVAASPTLASINGATSDEASVSFWGIYQIAFFAWAIIGSLLLIRLFAQKFLFLKSISPRERVVEEGLLYTLFKLCSWGGIDQKIVLTSSSELYSPLAMNRGEICLPERSFTELSPEQQQSMLAHELAHIVRKDYIWLKFCNLLETVFFFQPLNRLMRIELQEVIEQRCDEWAIRSTGNPQPLADCLVKVAEWITEPSAFRFASGMALHQSSLRQRVMNILKNQYLNQKEISRMKVLTVLALLFVLAMFVFPGKTWLSVSFAHNSKLGNFFNHQSFGFGEGTTDTEVADIEGCGEEEDCGDAEAWAEIHEVPEMPELPEMPEAAALENMSFPDVSNFNINSIRTSDTLRFGKDFMLITKGNGRFDIYKDGKFVEKEDYGKYKDDFIVKNDNNIEILSKSGINISTGKDRDYTPWAWSGQGWEMPPMPALAPLAPISGFSFGNRGIFYGFDEDARTYHGEKDGKEVEIRFDKEDNIKGMEIDGEEIKKEDFSKYQDFIDDAKKYRESMKKYQAEMQEYKSKMLEYEQSMNNLNAMNEKLTEQQERIREQVERQMEEVQRKQEVIMHEQERNMEALSRRQERQARVMEERAMEYEKRAQEKMDKILDELVKDGLIKSKKSHYEVRMNKRGLFVDDVKQSDELYEKYKKLIQEKSGQNSIFDDNWSFTINN